MTATLTIRNNKVYCLANNLEQRVEDDCLCYPYTEPNCPYCRGQGTIQTIELPYELNLANSNHRTLLMALGLDEDQEAELDPNVVLDAIACVDPQLLVRGDRNYGVVQDLGISLGQAQSYLERLELIAREAVKRGEVIVSM